MWPGIGSFDCPLAKEPIQKQAEHWNRQEARYDEVFLDPYGPGVVNPLWQELAELPDHVDEPRSPIGQSPRDVRR